MQQSVLAPFYGPPETFFSGHGVIVLTYLHTVACGVGRASAKPFAGTSCRLPPSRAAAGTPNSPCRKLVLTTQSPPPHSPARSCTPARSAAPGPAHRPASPCRSGRGATASRPASAPASRPSSRRASGPAPTRPGSPAAPGGRPASRRAPGSRPGAASPSAPTRDASGCRPPRGAARSPAARGHAPRTTPGTAPPPGRTRPASDRWRSRPRRTPGTARRPPARRRRSPQPAPGTSAAAAGARSAEGRATPRRAPPRTSASAAPPAPATLLHVPPPREQIPVERLACAAAGLEGGGGPRTAAAWVSRSSSPPVGPPRMPSTSPAVGRTPPWSSATPRASARAKEPSVGTCALPADKAGSQGRGSVPRSRVRPSWSGVVVARARSHPGVTRAQRRAAGGLHRKITFHEHPSTPPRHIAWSDRRTDRDRRRHHRPRPGRGAALHAQQTSRKAGARCLKCCARPSRLR